MTVLLSFYVALEYCKLLYVTAGCYLSAVTIKQRCIQDNSVTNPDFAARSLLTHLMNVFGGAVLSSFLLNESPIAPLANISHLLIALIAWCLVVFGSEAIFFNPWNHICSRLCLESMDEIWSMFKVVTGVSSATFKFGNGAGSVLQRLIVGAASGGGVQLVKDVRKAKFSILSERELLRSSALTIASLFLSIEHRIIIFLIYTTALIANKVHLVLHGKGESFNSKLARVNLWIMLLGLSLVVLFNFTVPFVDCSPPSWLSTFVAAPQCRYIILSCVMGLFYLSVF